MHVDNSIKEKKNTNRRYGDLKKSYLIKITFFSDIFFAIERTFLVSKRNLEVDDWILTILAQDF